MNSSATVTGCNDTIKRLRVAIAEHPLSPIHGYAADIAALLDRLDKAERENERLRAERDEHARWREKLADDLHERESQIIDGWAALRDSGVQSEKNIADGIKLLRAENERLREDAARYRWLRGDSCPDHSPRWTQWEVRCWKSPRWSDDLRRAELDAAIDAARREE